MGISTTILYNSALFVTVLERYVERSERMRIERLEVSLSDQQAQPTRTRLIKTQRCDDLGSSQKGSYHKHTRI
jgi:hypothetical protein